MRKITKAFWRQVRWKSCVSMSMTFCKITFRHWSSTTRFRRWRFLEMKWQLLFFHTFFNGWCSNNTLPTLLKQTKSKTNVLTLIFCNHRSDFSINYYFSLSTAEISIRFDYRRVPKQLFPHLWFLCSHRTDLLKVKKE